MRGPLEAVVLEDRVGVEGRGPHLAGECDLLDLRLGGGLVGCLYDECEHEKMVFATVQL